MLRKFQIQNFRKISNIEYEFKTKNLIITGKNAQGKTSIGEALYFCAFLHSPRTKKKSELIKFDQKYSLLNVKNDKQDVKILLSADKIAGSINSQQVGSQSDLLSNFDVIFLDPQTVKLVEDSSSIRRRFINMQISQFDKLYFGLLGKYNQLLKQKRAILKQDKIDTKYFTILNQEINKTDLEIVHIREIYLNELEKSVNKIVRWLTNENEVVTIKYQKTKLYSKDLENREIKMHSVLFGNHLDEINIFIDDLNLRDFGSQGQKRTVSIAMHIAQMEILKKQKDVYPLVIIDDIFSDLDYSRQQKLYQLITKKSQAIIITPNLQNISPEIISNGDITKICIKDGEILKNY